MVKGPRVTELSGCRGSGSQRPTVSWTEHMKGGAHSSLCAALCFPDSKRHPANTATTEKHSCQSVTDSNPQSYVL